MTEKEKTLIYSYIITNKTQLENNVRQLQSNVRFRDIDIPDCVELIVALQRLQTFNEVTSHILMLLRLQPYKYNDKE